MQNDNRMDTWFTENRVQNVEALIWCTKSWRKLTFGKEDAPAQRNESRCNGMERINKKKGSVRNKERANGSNETFGHYLKKKKNLWIPTVVSVVLTLYSNNFPWTHVQRKEKKIVCTHCLKKYSKSEIPVKYSWNMKKTSSD